MSDSEERESDSEYSDLLPEDCLDNDTETKIAFKLVSLPLKGNLRKRAYHHWGIVAEYDDEQGKQSVLFEMFDRNGYIQKDVSFYDKAEDDRWQFTENLDTRLMKPSKLLRAYKEHPMKARAYHPVKHNCQTLVQRFMNKV